MKKEELLRQLPAVHELVSSCQLTDCPPQLLTAAARDVLSYWRTGILEEGQVPPNFATLAAQVDTVAREMVRPNLRPVTLIWRWICQVVSGVSAIAMWKSFSAG